MALECILFLFSQQAWGDGVQKCGEVFTSAGGFWHHPGPANVALGHLLLAKEMCQCCWERAPGFRFEEQAEMGWLRQVWFPPGVRRVYPVQEQKQSLLKNPM